MASMPVWDRPEQKPHSVGARSRAKDPRPGLVRIALPARGVNGRPAPRGPKIPGLTSGFAPERRPDRDGPHHGQASACRFPRPASAPGRASRAPLLPSCDVAAPSRIRTVVFDLDDTLIVEEATARASIRATAAEVPGLDPGHLERAVLAQARRLWHGGPHHAVCAELGFASWEGLWSSFDGGYPWLEGLRRWVPSYQAAAWRAALAELGIADQAAAAACAEAFVRHQRLGHPLIDGAAATVGDLSLRYQIALLTNGPPDIQRHKLEATGLGDCFDVVIISGEVGVAKPDPSVFALTLERLGAAANTTVMVGDNWDRDVVGATAAGWSGIWVSGGRPPPNPADSVPAIRTVVELIDHLG